MENNTIVKKKRSLLYPNIISVTLRLAVLAALGFAGWKLFGDADLSALGTSDYVKMALLAIPAVAIILNLCIWGLKWVKNERVSELGLHIVRFAVILFAVMLGVFAMLTVDYTAEYRGNISTEMSQQALAGRIYIQDAIGAEVEFNPRETGELSTAVRSLLISDSDVTLNKDRYACLYLFTGGREIAENELGGGFSFVGDSGDIIGVSSSSKYAPAADVETLRRVFATGEVEYDSAESASGSRIYACSPVYTTEGRPAGVLEICQAGTDSLNVFNVASLELFLRMAAFICLFAFGFYGIMQLVDIALRPRNYDQSRKVLQCGRESARPILFFVALTVALPAAMLLFSEKLHSAAGIEKLPAALGSIMPLLVYFVCICLGYVLVSRTGERLTELPSDFALGVAAVCNLLLLLLLDLNLFRQYNKPAVVLGLLGLSGLCCGISFKTIKKYQKQSDRLFSYDKYAYLCSSLGAITGLVLGAVFMERSGDMAVRLLMIGFAIVTCVLSTIMLEDLNSTAGSDYVSGERKAFELSILTAGLPMAAAVGFDWVYISRFMRSKGYGADAIAFCMAMPVIAFCFGNRMRLRSNGTRRAAAVICMLLCAAAYVPLILSHSAMMAVVSALILSIAMIFGSSALYSTLCREERARFAGLLPLGLGGAMVGWTFAITSFLEEPSVKVILIAAIASAVLGAIYLVISLLSGLFKKNNEGMYTAGKLGTASAAGAYGAYDASPAEDKRSGAEKAKQERERKAEEKAARKAEEKAAREKAAEERKAKKDKKKKDDDPDEDSWVTPASDDLSSAFADIDDQQYEPQPEPQPQPEFEPISMPAASDSDDLPYAGFDSSKKIGRSLEDFAAESGGSFGAQDDLYGTPGSLDDSPLFGDQSGSQVFAQDGVIVQGDSSDFFSDEMPTVIPDD